LSFATRAIRPQASRPEKARACKAVKAGGAVFRHDEGSAAGPPHFWNAFAKELPVKHLEGTTLLCSRERWLPPGRVVST
jgi:hypothetical protein